MDEGEGQRAKGSGKASSVATSFISQWHKACGKQLQQKNLMKHKQDTHTHTSRPRAESQRRVIKTALTKIVNNNPKKKSEKKLEKKYVAAVGERWKFSFVAQFNK